MVAHNRTLSEAQELAICQYLDHLDRGGPKARYKQLEQAANALLIRITPVKANPQQLGRIGQADLYKDILSILYENKNF